MHLALRDARNCIVMLHQKGGKGRGMLLSATYLFFSVCTDGWATQPRQARQKAVAKASIGIMVPNKGRARSSNTRLTGLCSIRSRYLFPARLTSLLKHINLC